MSSPSKICMNGLCGATATPQWKRGWPMKAGGFAILCYSCGTAYDNVNYCERFHLNEPGWRECKFCDKPIHCGCVVSKYLHECLDLGGISCMKCLKSMRTPPLKQSYVNDIPNGFTSFSGNWRPPVTSHQMNGDTTLDKGKLMPLSKSLEKHQHSPLTPSISQQFRQDKTRLSSGEFGMGFSSSKDFSTIFPNNSPLMATPINNKASLGPKAMGTPSSSASPVPNGVMEERVQENVPSFKQGQKSHHIFPKLSKSGVNIRSQFPKSSKSSVNIHPKSNKGMGIENRVARRPAEGRGRNQLLPRYWPKITDQELLQISGDLNSNCTIVPLFEKVLSASDAGRIGRLVLPKACAEAYFPPINQSEGLPIQIQDIKGKEWTFQFRFWPNNNSRMYVLEGVTPCIQNMQLQAGDIVIFSRLDPGEKLVIGCRKAEISADTQEAETSALPNGVNGGTSVGNETPTTKNGEHEEMANWDPVQRPEKKKSRNIGSKSKRLLMNSEDAMELKVTWEDVQEFLRPAPTSEPTVVMIDNCEFEEYDEPPVFGKKTIFTMPENGLQEQWVECDSCSKWRKLPTDVLLPPKWTCSDNVSDPNRSSCSAPEEIRARDLERILKVGRESKKRKLEDRKSIDEDEDEDEEEEEPSGLDALATAAVLGESNTGELGESSTGPTTRHPRHRPGCSCIVCIQPPSGKGKHKPNCICNVCATVKRRFKTLMLRKKKQQRLLSEKEESPSPIPLAINERNGIQGGGQQQQQQQQQLDLNCDPIKEEEMMNVEWQNVLSGLVHLPPKGTTDVKEEASPEVEDTMAVEGTS